MFNKLEDAAALTVTGGVWSTREVHELDDRLFVKIGAGFVPIVKEAGTLMAKVGNKVHTVKDVTGVANLAVRFDGMEVRRAYDTKHSVYLSKDAYDNLRKPAETSDKRVREAGAQRNKQLADVLSSMRIEFGSVSPVYNKLKRAVDEHVG